MSKKCTYAKRLYPNHKCWQCGAATTIKMAELSNCHQAPLKAITGDEGTSFYQCSECKEPCDPSMADIRQILELYRARADLAWSEYKDGAYSHKEYKKGLGRLQDRFIAELEQLIKEKQVAVLEEVLEISDDKRITHPDTIRTHIFAKIMELTDCIAELEGEK